MVTSLLCFILLNISQQLGSVVETSLFTLLGDSLQEAHIIVIEEADVINGAL